MMPPDNLVAPPPPANRDENHHHGPGSSSSRKTASRPAEPQALKCPRCDSPNTKFCYYNNYSLTQPRHFCKTCRRYWTKGGALRNVPIGGGCRKNKKISKSACSRLSSADSKDSANTASYIDLAGFKFFNGLSPAMDFQLGRGGGFNNYPPRFHNNYNHQSLSSSFGDVSTPLASSSTTSCFGVDPSGNNSASLMGFNFPLSSNSCGVKQDDGNEGYKGEIHQDMGLASSIESLSSINQDLHWKLQQQRLAMLFGGGENDQQKETTQTPIITQKSQPILFQNLEISSKLPDDSTKDNINGNLETEWYFDNSNYAASAVNIIPSSTPANSNSTGNGFQGWGNFNQYTPLP